MPLGEDGQAAINQYLAAEDGDFSLTPPAETYTRFKEAGFEEAAIETQKVVQKIQIDVELDEHIMPTFPVPAGETSDSYLRKLCVNNLEKRIET